MLKSGLMLLAAGLLFAAALGAAQQSNVRIKQVPITQTSPTSGHEMYDAYCASCHGIDGRGDGPAAPALKAAATDLTALAQNNGGKFPMNHVIAVLQFGEEVPAHGSKEMPVWGPLFRSLGSGVPSSEMAQERLRIHNLARYLETLQAK